MKKAKKRRKKILYDLLQKGISVDHVFAKSGHSRAREEFESFASVLHRQNWGFNEYMHGETGEPMGKEHQSWSAAGYIIAYHAFHPECDCFYWGVD